MAVDWLKGKEIYIMSYSGNTTKNSLMETRCAFHELCGHSAGQALRCACHKSCGHSAGQALCCTCARYQVLHSLTRFPGVQRKVTGGNLHTGDWERIWRMNEVSTSHFILFSIMVFIKSLTSFCFYYLKYYSLGIHSKCPTWVEVTALLEPSPAPLRMCVRRRL